MSRLGYTGHSGSVSWRRVIPVLRHLYIACVNSRVSWRNASVRTTTPYALVAVEDVTFVQVYSNVS